MSGWPYEKMIYNPTENFLSTFIALKNNKYNMQQVARKYLLQSVIFYE